jgi:hypothetical protein
MHREGESQSEVGRSSADDDLEDKDPEALTRDPSSQANHENSNDSSRESKYLSLNSIIQMHKGTAEKGAYGKFSREFIS